MYRQTSRELKRIESLMRSHVYSSFAEQVNASKPPTVIILNVSLLGCQ